MGIVAELSRRLPEPVAGPARTAFRRAHRDLEGLPARLPGGAAWPLRVYAVYRERNAAHVRAVVDQLPPGSKVALHALDAISPALADVTLASGPGLRMPLLQALVDASPPERGEAVLLLDDDVAFRAPRTVARFARIARAAAFDIAQPAHARSGHRTFGLNGAEYATTARLVPFVEVGPVVLLSPDVLADVLPFPSDAGMGWGVDVLWTRLRAQGRRLGVVDATPVEHLGPVAVGYDNQAEQAYLRRCLDETGFNCIHDAVWGPHERWHRWESRPPWLREGPAR